MYHNPSPPQQESPMNLLISPFEPDQMQYATDNTNNNHYHQFDFNNNEKFDYNNHATQPLDVPMQTTNSNMNLYGMSPVAAMTSGMSTLYNRSPSPQATMNNFANEFISRSPESSSSAETNLVSPPQQFPDDDFSSSSWANHSLGPTPFEQATSQYNHHPATKRSSSVPPHFHKFKPNRQDSMYNQFQVTPTLHHQNHHMMPPTNTKALPIQISRMNPSLNQMNRPMNVESRRRQLDEKLEKVNFDDITVAELKEMLRERGLSATGRKAELMNRLKEEYELLAMRGGAAAVAAANAAQQQQQMQAPLHRRVANLNLMDSPISNNSNNRQQRLYAPYSPPPSRQQQQHRLASSVPDSHTQSYLNEQFMIMKNYTKNKPSCLRKSVDEADEPPSREWIHSFSASPPHSSSFYPQIQDEQLPSNVLVNTADVWDDQTLQNFLKEI